MTQINEETMALMELKEENHLMEIYDDKRYRGWYIYKLIDNQKETNYTTTIVRFRMPPAMVIYNGVVRKFKEEERLVGLHRMLIGKDIQDDAKKMQSYEDIDDYIESLTEEEITDMVQRMDKMITFDCNKIPYQVITIIEKDNHIEEIIKKYVKSHPLYLNIFKDVLNSVITIDEAKEQSRSTIYNEFLDLGIVKNK